MFLRPLLLLVVVSALPLVAEPRLPLVERIEDSARHEWENKPVLARRLLDDAESPATWKHAGFGTLAFTRDHTRDGGQAVRLHSPTKGGPTTKDNRSWGYCTALRPVASENWTEWNRVSFWVYPDAPGHLTITLNVVVRNGANPGVGSRDNIVLKNQRWNHVVSEIEFLPRDQVTGVEFRARLNGHEVGTSDTLTYLIDDVELQRVVPDHYVGWSVAPGHLAYSHSGYTPGAPKSALASGLAATSFRVLDTATGAVAFQAPVLTTHTARGTFQLLDFSALDTPGRYRLEADDLRSTSFPISSDVWLSPLEKALNFYYVLRCGMEIPGVHRASNLDWRATRSDKAVSLVGGWYDAGDLSQALYNTGEATFVLFDFAERLAARGERPELVARLVKEATWGLDWVLKTTLHDGHRPMWAVQGWWSDGIVGNDDDPRAGFDQTPENFFIAASAEAIAARVLKNSDPVRAAASLRTALEDWGYGLAHLATQKKADPVSYSRAAAVRASLELLRTTGEARFASQARALAPDLVAAQQATFIPGGDRLAGFLYEDPQRERILHSVRGSGAHEHNQILALADLCETFPDAPEWMTWYAAVARYGDLQRRLVSTTAPYAMLPAGVYANDEPERAPERTRALLRRQLAAALPVGDAHVVRAFPANDGGFGNQHLLLTQAKGLAAGARLRGDLAAAQLAERQLEWTFGRNPFARSFMYGEGRRYLPLYSQMNGDIVGALPVGLPTFGATDEPYWIAGNNQPAPKEVWIQSVTRFVTLAVDLLGPARLLGRATTPVEIRRANDTVVATVSPDAAGNFTATLPAGHYHVHAAGLVHAVTLLPGDIKELDPHLTFSTSATRETDGRITIRVRAEGEGSHHFTLRTENLNVPADAARRVVLARGVPQEFTWTATLAATDRAWFAVVVPDGDLTRRLESRLADAEARATPAPLLVGLSLPARPLLPRVGPAFAATVRGFATTPVSDETARVVSRVAAGELPLGLITRHLRQQDLAATPALVGTPFAVDGLVFAVPATNPVANLTAEQIRSIWTGELRNWRALGGPDLPIVVLGRPRAYDPIRLFGDFLRLETQDLSIGVRHRHLKAPAWSDLVVATPATDAEALARLRAEPGAVSFFPFQFLATANDPAVKPLSLDGVAATHATLRSGPYLVRRTLTAVTLGAPNPPVREFVDFLLSPAARSAIAAAGFVPLSD